MSALTADFDSYIKNERANQAYVAATSAVIYRGGLVQLNPSGLAIPAAIILSGAIGKIVGRAVTSLDGTEAAGSTVTVEEGDVFLNTDGSVVQTTVGAQVYAADDHTCSTSSTSAAICGIVTVIQDSGAVVRSTLEANR